MVLLLAVDDRSRPRDGLSDPDDPEVHAVLRAEDPVVAVGPDMWVDVCVEKLPVDFAEIGDIRAKPVNSRMTVVPV